MEIRIVRNVLEENDSLAGDVRSRLKSRRETMINFMSSPGSGKTTLLQKLIPALLKRGLRVGVIEGDITTSNDADRLQPLGVPIALINTEYFGGDCHLAANVILAGLGMIQDSPLDLILIENVGNLVCPAEFDTGADANVVLFSVTEGEDKPLKYPIMFRNSRLALVNKADLAAAAETDLGLMRANMRKVNPRIEVIETSGKRGLGIAEVADWVVALHKAKFGQPG